MKKETSFDFLLKQNLEEITKNKEPHLIYEGVQQKLQQERTFTMKSNRKKHISIAVICCFFLLTVTGFAIGKITGFISSARFAGNNLPTEKQWITELGKVPMFVESFSNGYTFDSYYKGDTSQVDDNNTPIETVTVIDLNYIDQNQNRNDISLTIQAQWKQQQEDVSTPNNTEMIDDIQINIYETDNKFVPVNYQLTETDEELQKKGVLNIAYGSDTIEEKHSTLLTWNKDSLSYSLLYMGQKEVSQKELLNMASEIISNYK